MSTKTTLAQIDDGDCLEVDHADSDGVWLRRNSSTAFKIEHQEPFLRIAFRLAPETINTIARLHSEKRFPHQQQESRSDMIKAATLSILGGLGAIRPELFAKAKARVAAVAGMDVNSEEFESEFSRALLEIACPLD